MARRTQARTIRTLRGAVTRLVRRLDEVRAGALPYRGPRVIVRTVAPPEPSLSEVLAQIDRAYETAVETLRQLQQGS